MRDHAVVAVARGQLTDGKYAFLARYVLCLIMAAASNVAMPWSAAAIPPQNPFLSVDFGFGGPDSTQQGFESFTPANSGVQQFVTSEGNITVAFNGFSDWYIDRNAPSDEGSFTFSRLYRDF